MRRDWLVVWVLVCIQFTAILIGMGLLVELRGIHADLRATTCDAGSGR